MRARPPEDCGPMGIEVIKERLFGDWKSSLIALVLLGILVFLGYTSRVEWATLQVWFVGVVYFLLKEDSKTKAEKADEVKQVAEMAALSALQKQMRVQK